MIYFQSQKVSGEVSKSIFNLLAEKREKSRHKPLFSVEIGVETIKPVLNSKESLANGKKKDLTAKNR